MSGSDSQEACDCPPGLTRRQFLSLGTLAGASVLAEWSPVVQAFGNEHVPEREEWGDTPVVLREGTNLAIALSPDGKFLAMDLQGMLWTLPVKGGKAQRLTGYLYDVARPHWSPDGRSIVFQSYRDGSFQLWMIAPDGRELRQITEGEYDCREPRFSPDGRALVFAGDRSGHYAIYVLTLDDGRVRCVVDTGLEDGEPAWSPDGSRIAFSSGGRICSINVSGEAASLIVEYPGPGASAPEWTPDGKGLVYRVLEGKGRDLRSSRLFYQNAPLTDALQDVFPVPVVWLDAETFLYTADGKILARTLAAAQTRSILFEAAVHVTAHRKYARRKRDIDSNGMRPVKGLSFPALSPAGDKIAFGALNQMWVLDLSQAKFRKITDDIFAKIGPAWSPDGKTLAYASDRGGVMQLWLHEIESGDMRVLTHEQAGMRLPSWSPDGMQIACQTHDGWLCVVDVASGQTRRVLRQTVWSGRASWSPDGKRLALAAVRPYSGRYREGINAMLVLRIEDGHSAYYLPKPGVSLDVRNVNGPVWSSDGRYFFYTLNGAICASRVDAEGQPEGAPVILTSELADAISLSHDGHRLAYLNNGRLRMLALDGLRAAAPLPVSLALDWQPVVNADTTVVHAGRCWDGRSDTMLEDVDIIVRAGRIVAVEPHRAMRGAVQWIDARGKTVMPGLMDMHTHREMGIHFGGREPRIFLAYGITTTRGLGENAYLMVENRESVDAGARIGPRHFGTGEALDGRRVFYDGMRPVKDAAQLAREFERARALEYDLIKCYVRLPPDLQALVSVMAHEYGIPVTSHYLFPAVAFGADGYEHMGGTSRFGYSRTGSTLGAGYQDVLALTAASGGFRTPTLFGLETLLAHTPDDVLKDPRIQTLFPVWERAELERYARGSAAEPLPVTRKQVAAVIAMQQQGVKVICGSDYPIVAPGLSLHLNLRAMVYCGMRPVDALRTATSVAGEVLGYGHGVIAVGALADLVVIDGNPLERIEDAARVESVMVRGIVHTQAALLAPYQAVSQHIANMDGSRLPWLNPMPEADHWWHDPHWVHAMRSSCCNPTV